MMTIHGVGHITALTFVLTLGDETRFSRSRDVGCYLGLRPKRSQSGERDPQLGITKAGNAYLRSLLIECANQILRPHGRDWALRQWGLHLAARGGKQAKNKSVVAVARKLAVLLHHLWTTQQASVATYGNTRTSRASCASNISLTIVAVSSAEEFQGKRDLIARVEMALANQLTLSFP